MKRDALEHVSREIDGEQALAREILDEIKRERHKNPRASAPEAPRDALAPIPPPTPREDAMLSLGVAELAPYERRTFSVTPYTYFKGTQFMCNESVPGATVIEQIWYGKEAGFPNNNGIATSLFSPAAFGVGVTQPIAQPGMTITCTIRNSTDKPVTWSGAIYGRSLV